MPSVADDAVPVFPTVARSWDDPGTERLEGAAGKRCETSGWPIGCLRRDEADGAASRSRCRTRRAWFRGRDSAIWPRSPRRFAATARRSKAMPIARAWPTAMRACCAALGDGPAKPMGPLADRPSTRSPRRAEPGARTQRIASLRRRYAAVVAEVDPELVARLGEWPAVRERYASPRQSYAVRGRTIEVENRVETLSGTEMPKVALPRTRDWGELARYLGAREPARSLPLHGRRLSLQAQRGGSDPDVRGRGRARAHQPSLPLPERRSARRPALDGLRQRDALRSRPGGAAGRLRQGGQLRRLDLHARRRQEALFGIRPLRPRRHRSRSRSTDRRRSCSPSSSTRRSTSTSSGICRRARRARAGPRALRGGLAGAGRVPAALRGERCRVGTTGWASDCSGSPAIAWSTRRPIESSGARSCARVRGTVQADILKEDQAQNTCIFSTEFALKMQGDIQETFCRESIQNFYSVSISGYHMAEAGANPITQLAFTLANGFTFCEYFLARGMSIDDFAPNLSFFFSNGLDAEYSVLGRVARRIWAIAMRERYGASERSQKLKYHIQTSGRSLHAQEMDFNDIRTTLQALTALQDVCNSLHTNAYDEAVTTPTEASVRRALAIQLIINREAGTHEEREPDPGRLRDRSAHRSRRRSGARGVRATHASEAACSARWRRSISAAGSRTRACTTNVCKHSGELAIIGVNTFRAEPEDAPSSGPATSPDAFVGDREAGSARRPGGASTRAGRTRRPRPWLRLQDVARRGGNLFDELLETVKVASLGQIQRGALRGRWPLPARDVRRAARLGAPGRSQRTAPGTEWQGSPRAEKRTRKIDDVGCVWTASGRNEGERSAR